MLPLHLGLGILKSLDGLPDDRRCLVLKDGREHIRPEVLGSLFAAGTALKRTTNLLVYSTGICK